MKIARPRYCLALFVDGFVPVISSGIVYNIDNEVLTVSGLVVNRQRIIVASPTNPNGKQEVAAEGAAMASDGGLLAPFRLVAGTSVATVIKPAAGRLCKLIYPKQAVWGSVTLAFYDDPNGATNNLIYTWAPGPGDILDLQIATSNGLSVIPSGATPQDVLISRL